jgi:hypothetical protein
MVRYTYNVRFCDDLDETHNKSHLHNPCHDSTVTVLCCHFETDAVLTAHTWLIHSGLTVFLLPSHRRPAQPYYSSHVSSSVLLYVPFQFPVHLQCCSDSSSEKDRGTFSRIRLQHSYKPAALPMKFSPSFRTKSRSLMNQGVPTRGYYGGRTRLSTSSTDPPQCPSKVSDSWVPFSQPVYILPLSTKFAGVLARKRDLRTPSITR